RARLAGVAMTETRVGIAGLGAIGTAVARRLASNAIAGMTLAGVSARDAAKAKGLLLDASINAPVLDLSALAAASDIGVECAPAAIVPQMVEPVLAAKKKVVVLSVGALLSHPRLIEMAKATGGQIIVPSGALPGLDAVAAAAEGKIYSVRMVT